MLQILKSSLNPDQNFTPRCLKDPILVSIDVGVSQNRHLDTVGIAYLDTRHLHNPQITNSITTRLLLLRRHYIPRNTRTCQYLFGIPEHSPPESTRATLNRIFTQSDPVHGGLRNIFLVGHHIGRDIAYLLSGMAFDVPSTPSITAVIDTQQLLRQVFRFQKKYVSLKRTLNSMGIQARHMHNNGNDAVYILKAMLHLFCNYQEDAIDQSKLRVGPLPVQREREELRLAELCWLERLDVLRETARCFPPTIALREFRGPRPLRLLHSEDPGLLETDTSSDGQIESVIAVMFGDET